MSDAAHRIRVEFRDHIAFLTFANPQSHNAMDLQFGREFLAAAFAIEAHPDVRVVLMSGEGKSFCMGGNLKSMVASGSNVQSYLSELTINLHAGMVHLARSPALVVAAVNGTAAGAGLGLVLLADIAIAARSSKFTPAYTAVGLTPDAGCTFLLPRIVGYKRAMELFLTNRVVPADEALALGMISSVVDDEALAVAAAALAAKLAAGPAGALGALKHLMAESVSGLEAQLGRESRSIAERGATDEGREGIAAFLAKRPPRYL
jgi:2-(1,2-epoxy-1,2-dihydrophenyl)acetyl-CoA isomerase